MNHEESLHAPALSGLELFQLRPGTFHSLDASAQLAGISRRAVALYCRAGLVHAVLLPPFGVLVFSDESIHILRRLEHLRTSHGLDVPWLGTVVRLLDEVEHLRAELRFLRGH